MPRSLCAALLALAPACTVIGEEPPADAAFSEGCGSPDPGHGPFRRELEVEGELRSYLVRFPGSYREDYPYPLIFALHGAGGDGPEIREYAEIEAASRARAIYVYPDAVAEPGEFSRWRVGPDSPDLDFLEAIRVELSTTQCVDEARTFVLGFSSGGTMANAYACFTDRVRAFASIGGGPPVGVCAGPVAAFVGHDLHDPVVPISAGEQTRDTWRAINGCSEASRPSTPGPCESFDCEGAPLTWCVDDRIEELAHTWPSWAADAIWDFFESS